MGNVVEIILDKCKQNWQKRSMYVPGEGEAVGGRKIEKRKQKTKVNIKILPRLT